MPGRAVVQWDKKDRADLGIIKVDLLGLGMMAVLEECLQLCPEVDLYTFPQDDKAVFEALQKADTIGMFQVESRAQMSCLPRLKPVRFYDIVAQVAMSTRRARFRRKWRILTQTGGRGAKRSTACIPRWSPCCSALWVSRYSRSNCFAWR